MPSGAGSTKANWQALRRLAADLFARLRRENPGWDYEDLRDRLELPSTGLFRALAEEAGFGPGGPLSPAEQDRIQKLMLGGTFSPKDIARQAKLPLTKVKAFLDQVGVPYSAGGYGMFPWTGEGKGKVNAETPPPEPRRVSVRGQLSYKGRVYGVGAMYAGSVCWVEEAGSRLVLRFSRGPQLTLRK